MWNSTPKRDENGAAICRFDYKTNDYMTIF